MTTTAAAIARIKALVAKGDSQQQVARDTGVSVRTIRKIAPRKVITPQPRNPNKYKATKETAYCKACECVVVQPCLKCWLKDKPRGACRRLNASSLDLDLTEEEDGRRAESLAEALRIKEDEPYEDPLLEEA